MAADLPVESPPLVPDAAALTAALERMDCVLATVLEVSPTAVRVVDVSGRIVRINERAMAEHATPQPVTLRELWERDQPSRIADETPLGFLDTPGIRALGGQATRGERLAVRRVSSGETCVVEFSASPVFSGDGKVLGAVIIDQQVDAGVGPARVALEVLAREAPDGSSRTDDDNAVTGPIHDVNNALNTIMAAAFLVQHHADSPDAMHDYAGRIQAAAEAAAFAARQLERVVRRATIPGDLASSQDATTSAPPASTMSGKAGPLDILLVEDNEEGREMISRLLRAEGHRVDAVATSAEARARIDSTTSAAPDLLLTDLELPDGNGWDLAAYARTQRSSLRIGVITGWDESIGSGNAVGADFVLRKPLSTAALLDHVAGRKAPALPE